MIGDEGAEVPNETFPDEQDAVEGSWWIAPRSPEQNTLSAWNQTGLRSLNATFAAFEPWVRWERETSVDVRRRNGGHPAARQDFIPLNEALIDELTRGDAATLLTAGSRDGIVSIGSRTASFSTTYICVYDGDDMPVPVETSISVTTGLHAWLAAAGDSSSQALEQALRRWEQLLAAPIEEWSVGHGWIRAERYGFTVLK